MSKVVTYNDSYNGYTSEPVGTVVITFGYKQLGFLWWKKNEPVWIVKIVKYDIFPYTFDENNYWQTIKTFHDRRDAEKFAKKFDKEKRIN